MRPVFRRGPDHRRPADVDVFDRIVERAAGLGNRLAKRIEIDDDQVDGRNAVGRQRGAVLGQIASRENAAVDLGMQRLDAAVQHFGKARVTPDVGDRHARVGERLGRSARREELDAARGEASGKRDDARLVGHRQQRLRDRVRRHVRPGDIC